MTSVFPEVIDAIRSMRPFITDTPWSDQGFGAGCAMGLCRDRSSVSPDQEGLKQADGRGAVGEEFVMEAA
jgi:hypothetical protein